MVKQDPKFEELDLNWEDGEYHVIDGSRLFNKDAGYILDNPVALNDRAGQTAYYPSMADPGNEVVRITFPKSIKLCVNTITRYHNRSRVNIVSQSMQQQNTGSQMLDPSKVMRLLAIHGMCIYENMYGCEIDKILHNSTDDYMGYNRQSVKLHDLKDLTTFSDTHSCRVSDKFKVFLKTWSEDASIPSQTMMAYWILLSLRTHEDLFKWYPVFDFHISAVNDSIETRLKLITLT